MLHNNATDRILKFSSLSKEISFDVMPFSKFQQNFLSLKSVNFTISVVKPTAITTGNASHEHLSAWHVSYTFSTCFLCWELSNPTVCFGQLSGYSSDFLITVQ